MSIRSFLGSRGESRRAILFLACLCGWGSIAQAQEYGAFHYVFPYDGTNAPLDFSRAAVAPTLPEVCGLRNEREMTDVADGDPGVTVIYVGLMPSTPQCGYQWLNMVNGPPGIVTNNPTVNPQFATCAQFNGFPPAYPRPALCFIDCPPDQKDENGVCRLSGTKNLGCANELCANPVHPGTGNKFQSETDYASPAGGELRLVRYYNSGRHAFDRVLGGYWQHTYTSKILTNVGQTQATSYRNDGKQFVFTLQSGNWASNADVRDRLVELIDANQRRIGWEYYVAATEDKELYDRSGRLIAITSRSGLTRTLTLADGTDGATSGNGGFVLDAAGMPTTAPLPKGLLLRVRDHVGRALTFGYDSLSRIVKITDPGGGVYLYGYGANSNLVSVTYPDASQRQYHYNEPAHTAGTNKPFALTGITDENAARFATYSYDSFGRAVESVHHAGGAEVNRYQFTYNTSGVQTTVTDPQGTARTYSFQTTLGVVKNTGIADAAGPEHGPAAQSYDANGNVASRTDWNGNRTNYGYDLSRNLETSRTEGLTSAGGTTPQTRTITTTWHPTFRLPTQIVEPGRTTAFTHDTNGNVLTKTVTSGSVSRTWTYTYNANGSVLTIDGPRTDISDVTTYTYYANDATCPGAIPLGCRGQVETITNAVGHVTSISAYNAHGQPLTIVDPNGLTTTLAYDSRQRLDSRNVGGEITSYDYDNVGQLTKVTLPDGSFLSYIYDNAHRLTEVSDNLGNRIVYTLDAMGNRTLEQVRDPLNALAQTRSRVFSNLNRLTQEIGAAGQTTAYGYDNQGNLTSIDGPLSGTVDVTTNAYDALNRLFRVTDPNSGQVNYGYDALDQLTSVSDPRSLVTSYSIDGLGNVNQQVSPDTGTTVNTYDAAGNLLTQTDAKSQVTSYAYDALNRVTSITYQGAVVHSYQYDQGVNGKGRLTQITEPNSTTQYVYDQKGRLTTETRTINAVAYVTSYSYDSLGRMTGMTYPSGRQVTYGFDALGRIQQVDTHMGGASQMVVGSVAYQPFGPAKAFGFGNGQSYARGFDQDGRIASYTLATQTFSVGFDLASRINLISENGSPTNFNTYSYDNLDRLTQAILPNLTHSFGYDAVGNRLTRTAGSSTHTYAYGGTSNRLSSITPNSGPIKTYVHDGNGSVMADGVNTYAYDTRGRLTQSISAIGTTNYQVNSLGQRIRKTNSQGDTVYHYDKEGRLIAESSTSGTVQKEYIYLGDIPVAVVQ